MAAVKGGLRGGLHAHVLEKGVDAEELKHRAPRSVKLVLRVPIDKLEDGAHGADALRLDDAEHRAANLQHEAPRRLRA